MSTYYQYRDVKVMIAHKLMKMEGWKVYGYKEDRSDGMTDYFDPANWDGVAEKNGYILCVDVYGASKGEEVRKYNYNGATCDKSIREKIEKLQQMTVERGASEQEEESAKMMIAKLQQKAEESMNQYVVVDYIPGHLENPPRCNWHIEKDGVIIAKGNGILKYAQIDNYYNYSHYTESMENFKKDKNAWIKSTAEDLYNNGYYTEEKAHEIALSRAENMEEDLKLIKDFESFINKINATCGGSLGEGENVVYEKVKVTEYKTELKPVEAESGSIKEGQLFILKSNFNYGCRKGLVYRIHATEYDGKVTYHAYKLNGKYTKECTGQASSNNYWFIGSGVHDNLTKWIEKGSIAWCELQEVKTPYEVEKVVKKTIKAEKKNTTTAEKQTTTETTAEEVNVNNYTYEVTEDTDTRTNERIWLVKVKESLSREEYKQVNAYIKTLGGYYSRYKHSFLFKEDPRNKLNLAELETESKADAQEVMPETVKNVTEATTERQCVTPETIVNVPKEKQTEEKQTENTTEAVQNTVEEVKKPSVSYTITEDTHTQTGKTIWIVKPDTQLSKTDFAEVKRKLATLKGFYSGFVNGFIFKYDPTENLQTG